MTTQQFFLQEFNMLPPEAQSEVIDFISFLHMKYSHTAENPAVKKSADIPLADEPFFGMWKDREDMQDTREWLRGIREREWTKRNQ